MSKNLVRSAVENTIFENYAKGILTENINIFLGVFKSLNYKFKKKLWFDIINHNQTATRFHLIFFILDQNGPYEIGESHHPLMWKDANDQTALQLVLRQLSANLNQEANVRLAHILIAQGSDLDFINDNVIASLREISRELYGLLKSFKEAKEGNVQNWENLLPMHQRKIWRHLIENNNGGVSCEKISQILSLYDRKEIDGNHPLSWRILERYSPLEATARMALLPNEVSQKRNLMALVKLMISYGATEIPQPVQSEIMQDRDLSAENFGYFLQHYQNIRQLRSRRDLFLNYTLFTENLEKKAREYYAQEEQPWRYKTPEIGLQNIKLKIFKHAQVVLDILSAILNKEDRADSDYKMPNGYFFGAIAEIFTNIKIIDGQYREEESLSDDEKQAISIFSCHPAMQDYWHDLVDIAADGGSLLAVKSWVDEKINELTMQLGEAIDHSSDDVSIASISTQDSINLGHYCEIFFNHHEEIINPAQMKSLWFAAVRKILNPVSEEEFEECHYLINKIIRNCHNLQDEINSPLFWQDKERKTALELLVDACDANDFNVQIISELLHHGANYDRIPEHKFAQIERGGYRNLLEDLPNPHSTLNPSAAQEVLPGGQQRR